MSPGSWSDHTWWSNVPLRLDEYLASAPARLVPSKDGVNDCRLMQQLGDLIVPINLSIPRVWPKWNNLQEGKRKDFCFFDKNKINSRLLRQKAACRNSRAHDDRQQQHFHRQSLHSNVLPDIFIPLFLLDPVDERRDLSSSSLLGMEIRYTSWD